MNNDMLIEFLEELSAKNFFIWTLYRPDERIPMKYSNVEERFVKDIEDFKKYINFLRMLNANNYDVYFTVNRFRDKNSRKAYNIESMQNKLYFDLDVDKEDKIGLSGEDLLNNIMEIYDLPLPTICVETSKQGDVRNLQIYYVLNEEYEFSKLQEIMQKIENAVHIDHTHDASRVFRLPSFFNKKKGKNSLVKVDKAISSYKKYTIDIFEKVLKEDDTKKIDRKVDRIIKKQTQRGTEKEIHEYINLLITYALDIANIRIFLKPNTKYSKSEYDFFLAKDLAKKFGEYSEAYNLFQNIVEMARKEIGDNKIERSPNYTSLTFSKAWQSVYNQNNMDIDF